MHHDVVVIGAGVAGIYQIKKLAELGLNVTLLERNPGLGGTWYRNRYPGARFDSESYTYGYTFSEKVLEEWDWSERFSPQPETLKYLNFVADKFDLHQHMRFDAHVTGMDWDEDTRLWTIKLKDGEQLQSRFVITTLGVMSIPAMPKYERMDDFAGQCFHTYWWPQEPVELEGRSVGVIGTGATGIQVISEIADKVERLTVFQRRPNWSVPLNNKKLSPEDMQSIRERYDQIFANCARSHGGFEHVPVSIDYEETTAEQRRALWDELYDHSHGFALLLANFRETFLDKEANRELCEYVAERIRQRVHDPVIAEQLIPKDHGFGYQRLPLETNYFEAYNRDNVELVDVTATPIERFTTDGIQTSEAHYPLDLIVCATGFDAITGPFDHIDIQGPQGTLREKWHETPKTYLGMLTHGFPNMFMVGGPQSASGSTNYPRSIEVGVDWISELLKHTLDQGYTRIDVEQHAEEEWSNEVVQLHEQMPFRKSKSWFTGYNSNVAGRSEGKVRHHAYWGGGPKYREHLEQARAENYHQIAKS